MGKGGSQDTSLFPFLGACAVRVRPINAKERWTTSRVCATLNASDGRVQAVNRWEGEEKL